MKGLKLTYHISQVSSIDAAEIKGIIMLNLKGNKYKIEAWKGVAERLLDDLVKM